jgi:hypothetical protein
MWELLMGRQKKEMKDTISPQGSIEHQSDRAYIIVKAAPRSSQKFGETVCIAGINSNGSWVRLYPVSFRYLGVPQRFSRWDLIEYRWRRPTATSDIRDESRRVDPDSIQIIGELHKSERNSFLNRVAVSGLKREREYGRSLALLKMEFIDFMHRKKSSEDLAKEALIYSQLRAQSDMLVSEEIIPREPCPYSFVYRYRDDDGEHEGTCQDWETEATFFRRRAETNTESALEWMLMKFGEEYPKLGMALAMGTHRYRSDQWLINGVIRLNADPQGLLL